MQSSIQTCTLYRQQSVSRYYFLSYLPKTCFISNCQDFAGDWYRWAAHCCSRANSIRTRYLWCSWRCCRRQRCLAYKKHKKKKHRHFWRLGKVIFYQQFGWLQVETFELLLHSQVWMWPVSHDSCGIICLQKRAASFRNIPQRWDGPQQGKLCRI